MTLDDGPDGRQKEAIPFWEGKVMGWMCVYSFGSPGVDGFGPTMIWIPRSIIDFNFKSHLKSKYKNIICHSDVMLRDLLVPHKNNSKDALISNITR